MLIRRYVGCIKWRSEIPWVGGRPDRGGNNRGEPRGV